MRALALLLALSGCGVQVPGETAGSAPRPLGRADLEDVPQIIHSEVNRQRSARQVDALDWSDDLASVAESHSQDMARRGFFAHRTPDGRPPKQRVLEGGVDCRTDVGDGSYREGVAENLYRTTAYESVRERRSGGRTTREVDWFTSSELAINAVESWLDSPGHRRNLLAESPSAHGIGTAISTDDRVYITQVLC